MRYLIFRVFQLFVIFSSVLILISCGSEEGSTGGTTSGTTGMAFTLEWATDADSSRAVSRAASGDVCQDYLIQNVIVNVYTTGNSLVTSSTFACSSHSGFVAVDAGTYNIIIDGTTSGGIADWRGQKTGIVVTSGATADAGTVTMAYIGTDTIKPDVLSTTPLADAIGVSSASSVTAVFSEDMAAFSVDTSTFLLKRGAVAVSGTVSYTSASKTAVFLPTTPLLPSTVYTAIVTTGALDLATNSLAAEKTWNFTTASDPTQGSSLWDYLIWDGDVWD